MVSWTFPKQRKIKEACPFDTVSLFLSFSVPLFSLFNPPFLSCCFFSVSFFFIRSMIPTFNNDKIVSGMLLMIESIIPLLFTNFTLDHLVLFIHGMGQQYEKYGNMKHHGLFCLKENVY